MVVPFGETAIERSQRAEARLLVARGMQPIAAVAFQDRASPCGLVGRRALVEFASADAMQLTTPMTRPKRLRWHGRMRALRHRLID